LEIHEKIHYAVDERKSNMNFHAVPLRQILTKCSKIKQAYEVLSAKNEGNLLEKYSHTTQISWISCWGILTWITLYLQTLQKD